MYYEPLAMMTNEWMVNGKELYAAARPDRPKGVGLCRWESSLRGREKEFKFGNEGISTEKNSNQFEDSIGEEVFTAESKPFASQKKL